MTDDDYPSRALDRIMVRLPDGMRDRLAQVAKANKRSVNAEVVARLEWSLSRTEPLEPKPMKKGEPLPPGVREEGLALARSLLQIMQQIEESSEADSPTPNKNKSASTQKMVNRKGGTLHEDTTVGPLRKMQEDTQ